MSEYVRWLSPSGRQSSWHIVRLTRSLTPGTLCGRTARPGWDIRLDLPAGKTCESCFRVQAAKA